MPNNALSGKPGTPVLWAVPKNDEQPLADYVMRIYNRLPHNPDSQLIRRDSDHLRAPQVATREVISWIRAIAAKN
jgi:hypothetical protein